MGRAQILIVIAIALVGAIGLALIVGAMTKHKSGPTTVVVTAPAPARPMAKVLVAKHDLTIGTRLGPDDLTWQDWPADGVNPAFITDGQGARVAPTATAAVIAADARETAKAAATAVTGGSGPMQQLYGAIVRQTILANEPVTNAKIVRGGEGGYMAVVLQPGMRAVAVPVNVNLAAGGFILPGDHVDVLQSHAADAATTGRSGFVAETLLRNVRVLAIDQNSQPPKGGQQSEVGATATLEVAAADVEIVARAKAQGDVILALRSYADAGGASGRVGSVDGGNNGTVRIFRSGQAPEVMVLQ